MRISLIAALANNRVIGKSNSIPWYLPDDIFWFKYHTLNKPIIMGRRTFESIGSRSLVNRFNVVLSRHMFKKRCVSNCTFVNTMEEALLVIRKAYNNIPEIMIIGGGEIYDMFFPYVSRLYLTYVNISVFGDTFFPYYNSNDWQVVFRKFYYSNDNNMYDYSFNIFNRV